MPVSASDGAKITPDQANKIIADFQKSDHFKGINGGFYGKNILLEILNQKNCIGIRYYHALVANKQTGKPEHTIVLMGTDTSGAAMTAGTIAEDGPLCPPICG